MFQRIMLAMATVLDPKVLIADEPTAALDVTIQAQIFADLVRLRRDRGTAILLITNNMGVVAHAADHVGVMYGASCTPARSSRRGMSRASSRPPGTPTPGRCWRPSRASMGARSGWPPIGGAPPDLASLSGHCAYIGRCPKALWQCRDEPDPLLAPLPESPPGHRVACYNPMYRQAG